MGIILKCLGEGYIHNILENWSYTNNSTELIMKHAILYMYILTTILLIWN